jgi:serine/threonine protein kinase
LPPQTLEALAEAAGLESSQFSSPANAKPASEVQIDKPPEESTAATLGSAMGHPSTVHVIAESAIQREYLIALTNHSSIYKCRFNGVVACEKAQLVFDLESLTGEACIMMLAGAHPNVLHVHGICKNSSGGMSIILDMMTHDLREALSILKKEYTKANRVAIFTKLLNYASQCAQGLSHVHSRGLVHQDVAARNMMLTSAQGKDTVRVADFGIAAPSGSAMATAFNKPLTTAPECIKDPGNQKLCNVKADVWSFGLMLCEIFDLGDDPLAKFDHSVKAYLKALDDGWMPRRPALWTKGLWDLIGSCVNVRPDMRPSMSLVAARLQDLHVEACSKQSVVAPQPSKTQQQPSDPVPTSTIFTEGARTSEAATRQQHEPAEHMPAVTCESSVLGAGTRQVAGVQSFVHLPSPAPPAFPQTHEALEIDVTKKCSIFDIIYQTLGDDIVKIDVSRLVDVVRGTLGDEIVCLDVAELVVQATHEPQEAAKVIAQFRDAMSAIPELEAKLDQLNLEDMVTSLCELSGVRPEVSALAAEAVMPYLMPAPVHTECLTWSQGSQPSPSLSPPLPSQVLPGTIRGQGVATTPLSTYTSVYGTPKHALSASPISDSPLVPPYASGWSVSFTASNPRLGQPAFSYDAGSNTAYTA